MEDHHDRIRDIFIAALEKPVQERAAYLAEACGDDAGLRRQVERLIDADGSTGIPLPPAPNAAPLRFPTGTVLAERFRVVRYIAAGGMGDVYEVEDVALNARLAMKTIRSDVAGYEIALARFKQEIQFAKRVTHPNVCRIHDLGSHHEGGAEIVFLTMELLPGQTLAERLRAVSRMDTSAALSLVVQMADGLAAAHEVGIIHRDFKTSNVILVQSAAGTRAVVTDFGLARPTAPNEDASFTETGKLVGTPVYMAPEQMIDGELTGATDVYALGLVIYEMITGHRPFSGTTPMDSALKRLTQPPPSPSQQLPGLDPNWETAIMRCLEREPARRYQSPKEVVRELTGASSPTRTLTSRWTLGAGNIGRRSAIAGVALLALLAAVVGVPILGRHRPPSTAVRWYDEGTRALRDGTSFTAMNALERAVQLDPEFSLAHARRSGGRDRSRLHGQSQDRDAARQSAGVSIVLSVGGGKASPPSGLFRAGERLPAGGRPVPKNSPRKPHRRSGPPFWSTWAAPEGEADNTGKRWRVTASRLNATASSPRRSCGEPSSKAASR